jgi:hypothetical protein
MIDTPDMSNVRPKIPNHRPDSLSSFRRVHRMRRTMKFLDPAQLSFEINVRYEMLVVRCGFSSIVGHGK